MELHNHAVYTADVTTRSFCFLIFKLTRRLGLLNLLWIPLMIAVGIFLLVIHFLELTTFPLTLYIGIVFELWGLFFTILVIVIRKTAKKNPSVSDFVLYDDRLEVSVVNAGVESGSTYFYQNLFRVYETKTYFYLYIDKNQVYLIVKDGFSDEKDALSLREKLMSVLGKNYKNYT